MLRTVSDQPTLWDAILPPSELLVLPAELARVDALRLGESAYARSTPPIPPGVTPPIPPVSRGCHKIHRTRVHCELSAGRDNLPQCCAAEEVS